MALVPGKTVAQMAGESVTQDADLFYFLRGSNDFGITFVDLQTQFMGGITIEAGSQNYLGWNPATSELSMKALAITDVTVDATEISLAAYLAANYTVGDEHQEGDVIYLTAATGGTEAYIHNGGTAVTAADFEIINFPVITSLTGLTDTASASVNDGFLQWNAGGTQVEYVANIGEIYGGTGQNSYATGDMLYASGANTLTKLAAGSNTEVLTLAGGVPTWAAIVASDLNSVLTAGNTSGANDINLDKTGTATGGASQVGSQGIHFHSSIWDGVEVDRKFTLRSLPKNGASDSEDDALVFEYEGVNKMALQLNETQGQTLYVSNEQRPIFAGNYSSMGVGVSTVSSTTNSIRLQASGTAGNHMDVTRHGVGVGGGNITFSTKINAVTVTTHTQAGFTVADASGLTQGIGASARLAAVHFVGQATGTNQTPLLVQIVGAVDALKVDTLAKTIFTVPTTGTASINLPHGVEPTVPVNGDIWTTTAGTFARVNGVTVDLTDTGVVSGDGIYDGSGSLGGVTNVTMAANNFNLNSTTGIVQITNQGGSSALRVNNSTSHTWLHMDQTASANISYIALDSNLNIPAYIMMAGSTWARTYERSKLNIYTNGNAGDAGLNIGAKLNTTNLALHIGSSGGGMDATTERLVISNTSILNKVRTQIGVGAADTTVTAHIIGQSSGDVNPLRVDTSAINNALTVSSEATVGINTAPVISPSFGVYPLVVKGTLANADGVQSVMQNTSDIGMAGWYINQDNTTIGSGALGRGGMRLGGRNAVNAQHGDRLELFTQSTSGMTFSNYTSGDWKWFASSTQRMHLSNDGNFGLGTTAFGTGAAKVFSIGIGTAPSTEVLNTVRMYTTTGLDLIIRDEVGATVDLFAGGADGNGIYDGSGSLTAGATAVTMSTTDTLTFGTDALHIDFNSGTQRVAMNHTSFEGSETLRVNGNVVFNGDLELNSTGGNAIEQYRQLKTEVSVEILNKQYLNNSADAKTLYAQQGVSIIDNTAGTEDGRYVLSVMKNGTLSNMMDFQGGGIGVNTVPFASTQFHIDSATGYDALHVEVVGNTRFIVDSDGLTGVNIATPLAQLHVKGRSSGTGSTPLRVDTSAIDNALTVGSNANTGFGLSPAASRRVQIQGETATSGTYSMYVTDSASGDLFTIRNDGYSAFGRTPSSVARLITKGKGTTSTTASFISKNSADTDTLRIGDDGTIDMYNELTLTLSTDSDLRSTFSNPSVGTSARSSLDVNNGTSNLFHEIYSTLYTNTYIRNKGVIRANSQSDGIVINSGNNISGTIELGVSTSANNLTTATTALFINTNRTVHIGNGVGAPDASAVLEISGSTGGVVVPRMAAATASLISSPIDGNILYVTTTDGTFTSVGIWAREAGSWIKL